MKSITSESTAFIVRFIRHGGTLQWRRAASNSDLLTYTNRDGGIYESLLVLRFRTVFPGHWPGSYCTMQSR